MAQLGLCIGTTDLIVEKGTLLQSPAAGSARYMIGPVFLGFIFVWYIVKSVTCSEKDVVPEDSSSCVCKLRDSISESANVSEDEMDATVEVADVRPRSWVKKVAFAKSTFDIGERHDADVSDASLDSLSSSVDGANDESAASTQIDGEDGRTLELHEACLTCPSLTRLRETFSSIQEQERAANKSEICAYPDPKTGRTPLHCIALNHQLVLLSSGTSRTSSSKVENFITKELFVAFPAAISMEDHEGMIPFTEIIVDWIRGRRAMRRWRSVQFQLKKQASSRRKQQGLLESKLGEALDDLNIEIFKAKVTGHFAFSNANPGRTPGKSEQEYYDNLPPMVEWSLIMLSYIIENECQLGASSISGLDNMDIISRFRSSLVCKRGAALRASHGDFVVDKVACIPHLIEELLIVNDRCARRRVFNLAIIRGALLRRSSFGDGRWLLHMLNRSNIGHKCDFAEGAVFYLETISSLRPEDDLCVREAQSSRNLIIRNSSVEQEEVDAVHVHTLNTHDIAMFLRSRSALFDSVDELAILPSLVRCREDLLDRASVTNVVQSILDKHLSTRFATTMTFLDGLFGTLLVSSFRLGASDAMFHLSPDDVTFSPRRYFYASLVFVPSFVYWVFRDVNQIIAKWKLSPWHFWSDLLGFWNLVHSIPVYIAIIIWVVVDRSLMMSANHPIRESSEIYDDGIGHDLRVAVAVVTCGLWIGLLAYVKMVNKELATFILCIAQIMRDIKWFLIVLLVAMAASAQIAIALVLQPDVVIDRCTKAMEGVSANDLSLSEQEQQLCTQSRGTQGQLYYGAYTAMLGSFEIDSLVANGSSLLFFIMYTFLVSIVLLNVLIAIVSDSYAKSLVLSETLFGRARVMFVAEIEVMQTAYHLHGMRQRQEKATLAFLFICCFIGMTYHTVVAKVRRINSIAAAASEPNSSAVAFDGVNCLDCCLCIFYMFQHVVVSGILLRVTSRDHNNTLLSRLPFKLQGRTIISFAATALDKLVGKLISIIHTAITSFLSISGDDSFGDAEGSASRTPTAERHFRETKINEIMDMFRSEPEAEVMNSKKKPGIPLEQLQLIEAKVELSLKMSEDRILKQIAALVSASEERILQGTASHKKIVNGLTQASVPPTEKVVSGLKSLPEGFGLFGKKNPNSS